MLINEILDSTHKIEITQDTSTQFAAEGTVGGRTISFGASYKEQDHRGPIDPYWGVAFAEITEDGRHRFNVTGSGKELEVFAMVKDCMMKFIAKKNPKRIKFSADKDGGKDKTARVNVYDRLVKRFNIHGYEVRKEDATYGNETIFWLEKNAD